MKISNLSWLCYNFLTILVQILWFFVEIIEIGMRPGFVWIYDDQHLVQVETAFV